VIRATLGIVLIVAAVGVLLGFMIAGHLGERDLADACWDRGGIPVQGDAADGHPVVCLDPDAVLDGAK
jgi:hypothetical protein